MARDWYKALFAGAIGCIGLALLLILTLIFLPFFIQDENAVAPIRDIGPVAGMLLIILGGLLAFAAMIFALYEIAASKNNGEWKAVWIVIIVAANLFGLVLYEWFARKDLKKK